MSSFDNELLLALNSNASTAKCTPVPNQTMELINAETNTVMSIDKDHPRTNAKIDEVEPQFKINDYDSDFGLDYRSENYGMKDSRQYNKFRSAEQTYAALNKDDSDNNVLISFYKKECNKYNIVGKQVVFKKCNGNYVVMYLSQGLVFKVSKVVFKSKIREIRENKAMSLKVVEYNSYKILVIVEKAIKMQKQSFNFALPSYFNFFSGVASQMQGLIDIFSVAKNNMKTAFSLDFRLFLVDVLAMIVDIRDGFLTPSKVLAILMRLYTSYTRFHHMFRAQSLGVSDLVVGFTMLGMPAVILDGIKSFTMLTGKRIFDSNVLMDTASSFFTLLERILDFMTKASEGFLPPIVFNFLKRILNFLGGGIVNYSRIREVSEVYTQYVKNEQAMFDPSFREKIVQVYDKCIATEGFIEYVTNSNNKYFHTTWESFKNNVYKGVKAFDESRRVEPICIVFEGGAGSGKSALMNLLVDLLRRANYTTYVHTVPSTEDAKDFYDDYENQDVFIMDDVGQQGKSQWRQIINMVSPIKYPLPCATASKKNTKFFNSKIVVCTTNHFMDLQGFTSTDCIMEPEALFRRCHVIRVDRANAEDGSFAQALTYYKYAHMDVDKRWKNEFLYHNINNDIPTQLLTAEVGQHNRAKAAVSYVYKILQLVRYREDGEMKASKLSDVQLDDIIEQSKYWSQSFTDMDKSWLNINNGKNIAREWYDYYASVVCEGVKSIYSKVIDSIASLISGVSHITIQKGDLPFFLRDCVPETGLSINVIYLLLAGVLMTTATVYLFKQSKSDDGVDSFKKSWEECKVRVNEQIGGDKLRKAVEDRFYRQSDRVLNARNFVKLVEIKCDTGESEITHGVVSGDYILLPCHLGTSFCRIDIYRSLEHYQNGHKEMENVVLKIERLYTSCDLAVFKMKDVVTLYKKCWNLFAAAAMLNPRMYLVNSMGTIEVQYGKSVHPNLTEVVYDSFVFKDGKGCVAPLTHEPWAGVMTPLTGPGMCGSVLVTDENGIYAFHVAGCDYGGFMVVPSRDVAEDIRNIMLQGYECKYEISDKIIPEFSGVRLEYEKNDIKCQQINNETDLDKSMLHADFCPGMRSIIEQVEAGELTTVPVEKIDKKQPPNFRALGAQKKLLESISKKTFMHQGMVTFAEVEFIKKCIDSMMIDFDDVELDVEVAFGNEYLQPLNKDSSNGYGCLPHKQDYFDFDSKTIKEEGRRVLDKFLLKAENEEYDAEVFLCRESFKDELRKSTKVNEPRTFRVLPMPHIFYTKKLFGKLLKWFSENMHEFGCSVGLNPYKDFDVINDKLKKCDIVGDIDFAKWDGSCSSTIMDAIGEVFKKRYNGKNVKLLDFVLKTMSKSFVLVGDSLWATTHGLPSGTWLTLLLNCLINKALTALTIYRNAAQPTVQQFHEVVDYVMGDDKLIGASGEMAEVFNLFTIKEVAESLGMTCTNGDKSSITTKSHELSKLTFVKRHFRYHNDLKRVVGVLDVNTLLNTVQWYQKKKDKEIVMTGKMQSVQVEAFLHSKKFFNVITKFFREYYPDTKLFNVSEVMNILAKDTGYIEMMGLSGKDMSFMNTSVQT
jgi:hypothetical protein